MDKEKHILFYSWFDKYVEGFFSRDESINANIVLKREHTLRVTDIIKKIAESLHIDNAKLYLAEAIGLFHDIGRFEQYTKYKTFKDALSEDHAALGVKFLRRSGILEDAGHEEQGIILGAVEYNIELKSAD